MATKVANQTTARLNAKHSALLSNKEEQLDSVLEPGVSETVSEHLLEEGLAYYLRFVSRKSLLLTPEEEISLAKRSARGDRQAKQQLAQGNLRLVIRIAKRYTGREIGLMELLQEGNVGLMRAVEKFNPRLGYRFSTYATWWIKQAVFQAFNSHDRSIRLPGHVLDAANKVRRLREQLSEAADGPVSDAELAQRLGFSVKKVRKLQQVVQKPLALDAEMTQRDGNTQPLSDSLADDDSPEPGENLARRQSITLLRLALLEHLDDRERDILAKRYGLRFFSSSEIPSSDSGWERDKMTLEEIGRLYGVTRECIRQTEARALRKLRESSLLRQLVD